MALRTAEEYIESLRDGREIYMFGERVEDITVHPVIGVGIRHSALDYELAHDPALKELTTVTADDGAVISRYFHVPRTPEDLLKRRDLIDYGTRRGYSTVLFIKEIGTDCLFTLSMVCDAMDRELGTDYSSRVAKYREYCTVNDFAMAGAITDVKGDRSKRPSEQSRPDYYVRVVDRNKDGIVVRGAKVHITSVPYVNEIMVLPTRALTAADKDFAVAFAVPANAKGLKIIVRPELPETKLSSFDYPVSSRHIQLEGMVIFDDVFVPWERVFLDGEWQYAGALANTFATWHRFTGLAYKGPFADLLVGAAQLIADYNGVANAGHIRDKITRLIIYAETIRVYGRAAARECHYVAGISYPNPLVTNMGKHYFADNYHSMIKTVHEVAGGLTVTSPSEADFRNPTLRPYIDRYLGGRDGVSAENRLRLFKLLGDITASEHAGTWTVATVHGEGSIEAQRLTMYREYDLKRVVDFAKEVAGIEE